MARRRSRSPDGRFPTSVLLDVLMPDMSGFEVYRRLNARLDRPHVPVIFLSALDGAADKIAGLGLGAVDYVTKPIQPGEVLARVENHLTRIYLERELRRSRDRLDRELANAAELQRLMLPRTLPSAGGARFAAHYRTSRHAGGDYYDVAQLDRDRLGFIVADVSGHGAAAAIVMAMIRAVFHTIRHSTDDPAAVLRQINSHFGFLRDTAIFATAVYGVLDAGKGSIRFASAGHPLPLVCRRGGETTTLGCEAALPLLFADPGDIAVAEHPLSAGDRILLYTDGITDRQAPSGDMYEIDRLVAAFTRSASRLPDAIVEHIVADLETFAAGDEPGDDQTLLAIAID